MDIITLALAKKYADEKLTNIDSSSAQSDWDQNDENAIDYIKNRPFYSTGEYEKTEIMKATQFSPLGSDENKKMFMVGGGLTLIEGAEYLVAIGDQEYICKAQLATSGYLALGNVQYAIDSEFGWPNEVEPFVIFGFDYPTLMSTAPDFQIQPMTVYKISENIHYLDKKYVSNFLAGEKVANTEVLYDEKTYTCGEGAEIFNSNTNRAIGVNSHAEGERTVAMDSASHAEGSGSKALGSSSHTEGNNTTASGNCSHAEGSDTIASGLTSHAEGYGAQAIKIGTHAEGRGTIANAAYLHVQGRYNIPEDIPKYSRVWVMWTEYPEYDGDKIIYIFNDEPTLNTNEGTFSIITMPYESSMKELKKGDYFVSIYPESDIIDTYYYASELVSTRTDESTGKTYYKWKYSGADYTENSEPGIYAHIVGNGNYAYDEDLKETVEKRSNAHTLDWDGNAWYQGDVYVGSNSGVNRDEGSKKLATEDFVNEQIGNVSPVQSDWNQNDESELDYIKNRPFYAGDPELTEIFNGNISFTNHTSFINHFSLLEGETYQVIWNDKEYFCTCQKSTIGANQFLCIGNTSLAETDSTQWIDGEPFLIQDGGFATIVNTSDDNSSCSAIVNIYKEYVKLLDRKFISYIAGENVEGKIVTYNNQTYTCPTGAEIFNSPNNKAIGLYSHAEGYGTVAYGAWCHAEGTNTYVSGNGSHAEGQSTIVDGFGSHAEGANTKASGDYIHVEGFKTIASSDYQHVQGKYNVEDTEEKYAHIVGNGTENTPSNAHTLDWNGNAWYQGSVEATSIILSSPSGKRFSITVGDDGILTSTEIVLEE